MQSFYYIIKLRFSEKATKFDEMSILVLTLISNDKTKMEISSNFVVFLEYMNFTYKCPQMCALTKFTT